MKITCILTLLLVLSLSASAGTFVETFGGKELEGWEELVQLNKAPGAWEIIDNELHAVSRETFVRLLTTGDNTWEDYTIELDVKPLKKHGIGKISMAVRVKDSWVVYCSIHDPVVIIVGDDPPLHDPRMDCVVGDLHDTVFAPLHSVVPHELLRLNKWSHLKLSVKANIFSFWINGEQVMESKELQIFREVRDFADFPDFQTGGVGFGLANYTAVFDNITVTGDSIPNRGGLLVTPREKLTTTWGNLKRF